jgi:hypothetical protein
MIMLKEFLYWAISFVVKGSSIVCQKNAKDLKCHLSFVVLYVMFKSLKLIVLEVW